MLGIIIPVYNRADDLRMALKSLVAQTKNRFIVFVIDDASTDHNIKSVCDEFKSLHIQYSRLPINGGPGIARNYGLFLAEKMRIDSVMFLDSDDMLTPNTVERLSYELNHTKCDLIVSDIVVEHKYSPDNLIEGPHALTWTHGKIYRMSFLKQNNIHFPDSFKTNEDLAFNLCVYNAIDKEKRKYIPQQLYIWRDNKKSITRNNSEQTLACNGLDYINAIFYYYQYCISNNQKMSRPDNIINCYTYYQLSKERDGKVPLDIIGKLINMLTDTHIQDQLKDRSIWYNLKINNYEIDNKKFYFFKQSLYDWLEMCGFNFSVLGEVNENIYS